MKPIKSVLFALAIFTSCSINAATFSSEVSRLTTYLSGNVVVQFPGDISCNSNTAQFDESAPGFQRVFSVLLAAQAQGKKVIFGVSCDGEHEDTANVYSVQTIQ